jgi:hypothetical protein
MIAEKQPDEVPWIEVSSRTRPKDGEKAAVRRKGDAQAVTLIFRTHPIARWESLDGSRVYEFAFFDQWRRL